MGMMIPNHVLPPSCRDRDAIWIILDRSYNPASRGNSHPEQKVAVVRRHLIENVPVSDLCDEFWFHATQYDSRQ